MSAISPVIPHFASECLEDIGLNPFQNWPEIDKDLIKTDIIEYVIQINGKKRATIKYNKNISEEELMKEIMNKESTKKIIENKKIKKCFFVKNRLINILI